MGWFDWLFGPPTEAKFAQCFIAELQKAGEQRPIRFDPHDFQLVISENGEQGGLINLRNFYIEFCNLSPADRKRYLPDTVQAIIAPREDLPDDFELIKPHLRPKIWARAGIEHTNLQARLRGSNRLELPQYEVGTHLLASIVYDLPRSVRSISPDELENWNTSYYEALEIATQNLTEAGIEYAKVGEGLYVSSTGDSYDASRILLTDFIRSLPVRGDTIAMVPNRDTLLVAGSDDDEALEGMLTLAEQAVEGPRPLASTPLRLIEDDWVDWMPSRGHQLFDRFRVLEMKFLYQEYAHQKEVLEKLYEQHGIHRFVASYCAAAEEGENLFSYAIWSEGVETLLPQTERLMFFRPSASAEGELVASAPWHKVEKLVGHLMSDVDLYPRRFLVTEFPTDDELRRLGLDLPDR
jgi:hypothetical protein